MSLLGLLRFFFVERIKNNNQFQLQKRSIANRIQKIQ